MHQSVEINVRNIEFADNIFQMLSNIRIRPRMPPAAICLYFPSFIVWKSIGYYPILQIYWREYLFRRKGSTRVWEYIIILYTYMRVMCVLAHYPATSIGWRSPFHMHTQTKKKIHLRVYFGFIFIAILLFIWWGFLEIFRLNAFIEGFSSKFSSRSLWFYLFFPCIPCSMMMVIENHFISYNRAASTKLDE